MCRVELETCRQGTFALLGFKLHDGHGGHRAEIVWVDRLDQPLYEPGKFRIKLQVNPRGEKRETFEQPFNIRILAGFLGIAIQRQSAGHLWKITGKLRRRLPDMAQLGVVEFKQPPIHLQHLPAYKAPFRYPPWS